jgi:hypothetical protein
MRTPARFSGPGVTHGKHIFGALFLAGTATFSTIGQAAVLYDAGLLVFDATGQSIWKSGPGTVLAASAFLGSQWTNSTAGVGGFVGDFSTVSVNTNPAWWAWRACRETINFLCGSEPSRGTVTTDIDTRTGARVDLTTSGRFGIEYGYTVNSGTIDAKAIYAVSAALPATVKAGEYFQLNTASALDSGSISTQSPWVEFYVDAIAQLSGSVTGQACLITYGCAGPASVALPPTNLEQNILRIDLNSIKILDEFLPPDNPGDPSRPLAEIKLANQTLTLQAALDATGAPGFKLTSSQFTFVDTTPPTPDVTIDLASIEFKLPYIETSGVASQMPVGGALTDVITSDGRDDIAKLRLDVDGLVFALGQGSIPPLGIGVDLLDSGPFKIGMQLDALDIDIGPDVGITQDFELVPTLMVDFAFSAPVMIAGMADPQTSWRGAWNSFPEIALLGSTTFMPTFWIEAWLTHTIGLDLGLTGTLDVYKFSFSAEAGGVKILESNPLSLNQLLGLGNTLFSTSKLAVPIWDERFLLEGFGEFRAASFAIATVPTPGTVALLLVAVGTLAGTRRRPSSRRSGIAARAP